MPETTPPAAEARDLSRFDTDPDAIAWARRKILRAVERAEGFEKHNTEAGSADADWAARWRVTAQFMRRTLLGGRGCVIAAFDERLPEITKRLEDPSEVAW